MKKPFLMLMLMAGSAFAQNPSIAERLPERASWQVNYHHNEALREYLGELAAGTFKPNTPKEITSKLTRAIKSNAREENEGRVINSQFVKSDKTYFEMVNYEDARRSKSRYIINQNYVFSKRSNFPRYVATGKNAVVESNFEKSDFPVLSALNNFEYKGDVVYNRRLCSVYSVLDRNSEVDINRLKLAWLTTHGSRSSGSDSDDDGVSVTLPSIEQMRQDVYGDRSTVVITDKQTKRPLFISASGKVMSYHYTYKASLPPLPEEIVKFVENNTRLFTDRRSR